MLYKNIFEALRMNIFRMPIDIVLDKLMSIDQEKKHFAFYLQITRCVDELQRYDALDFLHTYLDNNGDILLLSMVYKKTFIKERIDKLHAEHRKTEAANKQKRIKNANKFHNDMFKR